MWNDEGWDSNPAIDLVMNGKFRTTVFRDFLNLDIFTFWYGPIYFLLEAFSFFILGVTLFSGRLVSVILAIIGINVFYKICLSYTKKSIAFILSILMGTFPYFFTSARQIRFDIAVSTFTILSVFYLYFKYYNDDLTQKKKIKYLILSGVFSSLALLSHPNGAIPIILNFLGILIYDIPIRIKFIFSKKLLLVIFGKLKTLVIFGIIIFLTFVPYIFFILLYYDAFQVQFGFHYGASFLNMWNNYQEEYLRYYGIIVPYLDISFFKLFPRPLQIILFSFLLFMFIFGFLTIFYMAIKEDHKKAKIIIIYILGIMLILGFLVYNKSKAYLCIFMPYPFLSIGYVFSYKDIILFRLKIFKTKYLKVLPKIFNHKILSTFKIGWIILLVSSHITILIHYYSAYQNINPYLIRTVFEKYSISNDTVIMGDPTLYLPLYDYNFIHYYPLYDRFKKGETIENLMKEYDPDIIIYDNNWRTYHLNDEDFINQWNIYIKQKCTLITKFNSSIPVMDPIYLYRVNN